MKTLIVIVGPTAIGKTALAIEVARAFKTEIVSCDSRQFYRELNVGVARPTPIELNAIKHHFIANRSIAQPYNAFCFEQDALTLLEQLYAQHDVVVAVGGSGLYVDALCNGITRLPDPTPELRQQLSRQIQEKGITHLQQQLKTLDPEYYNIVDLNNPIRLQRALETIITAGRPYSELLKQQRRPRPFSIVKIGLYTNREDLRFRINFRVDQMVTSGLLNEVHSLLSFRHLNTLNTVGYKELFSYFDGTTTLEAAVASIKNNTWHYAKKQITWFKRYPEILWKTRDETTYTITRLKELLQRS